MSGQKKNRSREEIAREAADYKRFLAYPAKQIVFYSEENGYYKYFKDVIGMILDHSDVVIHCITSDPKDEIFSHINEQFQTYYIGENKLIVLMMKMDADIVVMTTPDLQKYHIKRSIVRKDIEYVYMDHAVASANLTLRKHALDHFDTIFATNEKMAQEIRAMEETYKLPKKTIVKSGYPLIDNRIAAYREAHGEEEPAGSFIAMQPEILIAPSWQEDNIMDSCIEEMLDVLGNGQYHITVRPHPQYVRRSEEKLNVLAKKYGNNPNIELQTDVSYDKAVFDADVLITDWSGIAYEYAFATLKPVLFINTPMKAMNPDYKEIDVVPFDIEARNHVGNSVETDALNKLPDAVYRLLTEEVYSKEALTREREKYLYHIGDSAEAGAKYLLQKLILKQDEAAVSEDQKPEEAGAVKVSGNRERADSLSDLPMLHFLYSTLFLMFPVMILWLRGPLEIYAENREEFFFGTGDFFPMFLIASLVVAGIGAFLLSLLPENIRRFLHTLLFALGLCFFIQGALLNLDIREARQFFPNDIQIKDYYSHTGFLWPIVIYAVFVLAGYNILSLTSVVSVFTGLYLVFGVLAFTENNRYACNVITGICLLVMIVCSIREKKMTENRNFWKDVPESWEQGERIIRTACIILVLLQTVLVIRLLCTNPYGAKQEPVYMLSSEQEFSLARGKNIIVLILDGYGNQAFDDMRREDSAAAKILQDFTYYNNANTRYVNTFPSITYMLTHVHPDMALTTDEYRKIAWTEGRSGQFYDRLHANGYTYRFYTDAGRALYKDPAYLKGSFDNVVEMEDVSYKVNYGHMFSVMTGSSLLKYNSYWLKAVLKQGVKVFPYDGLISFEDEDVCVSDNGEYYRILKEQGLSVDENMENAVIITHLSGLGDPLTIDGNANQIPAGIVSRRQVQYGLNTLIGEYLQQLRDLDLYDEATIIITADHGQHYDHRKLWRGDISDPQPVFLMKRAGQKQDSMQINSAPISSEDLLPTLLTQTGVSPDEGEFFRVISEGNTVYLDPHGESVFDWHSWDARKRYITFLDYGITMYHYKGDREALKEVLNSGSYYSVHSDDKEDWGDYVEGEIR